ncbi:unnamed protein product, partial [Ectocarpus sp. 12 AP-2014]
MHERCEGPLASEPTKTHTNTHRCRCSYNETRCHQNAHPLSKTSHAREEEAIARCATTRKRKLKCPPCVRYKDILSDVPAAVQNLPMTKIRLHHYGVSSVTAPPKRASVVENKPSQGRTNNAPVSSQ